MIFADRVEAGRLLADRLLFLRGEDVVVLGVARGGVPVGFEIATRLGIPLDVVVVRKLAAPSDPEYGVGAIAEGGVRVLDRPAADRAGATPATLAVVEDRQRRELDRRTRVLRAGRAPVALAGRTALVVDDGLATGSTARAACRSARSRGAERVILAVPVGSAEAVVDLGREVEVICLFVPHRLRAVGEWYRDFGAVGEDEVVDLLQRAGRPAAGAGPPRSG